LKPVALEERKGEKKRGEEEEGGGATNRGLQSGEDTRSLQKGEDKSLWAGAVRWGAVRPAWQLKLPAALLELFVRAVPRLARVLELKATLYWYSGPPSSAFSSAMCLYRALNGPLKKWVLRAYVPQ